MKLPRIEIVSGKEKPMEAALVKVFIVVLLFIWIAGCSTGDGDTSCVATQSVYTYQYDQIGETGLTLKAMGDEVAFISFEEMEAEYIDLEACVANTGTPGPNVEFINFSESPYYRYSRAIYYYAILTAFIDTQQDDRNCISDREFLRHEYTHHVLHLNGEDPSHANPKFAACDALGPKTCNGEYCE